VKRILSGEKKYEFRKVIFKQDVDEVIIYASSPVKKFVASFKVGNVIKDEPRSLWRRCNGDSGLMENEFFDYFRNQNAGFAIKIEGLNKFNNPMEPKEIIEDFVAPQSFQYYDAKCSIGSVV
jgi:type I restriction enzyme S subunit